ncbi:MAG: PAS domain-containing protein [Rhodospirillales bacterium]|nr:PAS domain-containing protein [Rhodospirillales bacterium]MBO6785253.1 PAS domain-containing protein [Rhodospirillales bacterium]
MSIVPNLFRIREIRLHDNPWPAFDEVLAYWNRQRGDAFAPAWRDFDLMEIPRDLLPYTVVVDTPDISQPIKYRYFGSGIALSHGFEMTGKTSDDIPTPQLRDHIISQYRQIITARAPKMFVSEIYVKRGLRKQDLVLRLPLSNDGESVTNVVTVEHQTDENQTLTQNGC